MVKFTHYLLIEEEFKNQIQVIISEWKIWPDVFIPVGFV